MFPPILVSVFGEHWSCTKERLSAPNSPVLAKDTSGVETYYSAAIGRAGKCPKIGAGGKARQDAEWGDKPRQDRWVNSEAEGGRRKEENGD